MIRSLRVQNFKCFEDQFFDFKPLTLLTGLNGTGKSSVLQSLLLLRQSYQQGLLATDALALNGDLAHIGTGRDALFEGAKKEEIGFVLVLQNEAGYSMEANWHFEYMEESDLLDATSTKVDPGVYEADLFTDEFQYLQAERIGARRFFEKSKIILGQLNQLGSKGEYTVPFLSHDGHNSILNHKLIRPDAASAALRDQVEVWLREICPGAHIVLTQNRDIDIVSLQYSFTMGTQVSNNYRATNVGFGLTYTLPILVAVLSSFPGSLILIENPEAHLHPKGQAMMGNLLARAASCGIQVVVETHSDHVLNSIRVAVHDGELEPDDVQLHFFKRHEQDGQIVVVSPQIDQDGRLDQWPDGFFDEWDNSLEALLQPRKER